MTFSLLSCFLDFYRFNEAMRHSYPQMMYGNPTQPGLPIPQHQMEWYGPAIAYRQQVLSLSSSDARGGSATQVCRRQDVLSERAAPTAVASRNSQPVHAHVAGLYDPSSVAWPTQQEHASTEGDSEGHDSKRLRLGRNAE
jgi:hypothetical protein